MMALNFPGVYWTLNFNQTVSISVLSSCCALRDTIILELHVGSTCVLSNGNVSIVERPDSIVSINLTFTVPRDKAAHNFRNGNKWLTDQWAMLLSWICPPAVIRQCWLMCFGTMALEFRLKGENVFFFFFSWILTCCLLFPNPVSCPTLHLIGCFLVWLWQKWVFPPI